MGAQMGAVSEEMHQSIVLSHQLDGRVRRTVSGATARDPRLRNITVKLL